MVPSILVIADRAEKRDDRLDIVGIHNRRLVPSFPAVVGVVLVMYFRLQEGDWGDDHLITVRIVNEETAEELATLTRSKLRISEPFGGRRPTAYGPEIVPIEITFPSGGIWNFEVHDNGVFWQRLSYVVLQTDDPRATWPKDLKAQGPASG